MELDYNYIPFFILLGIGILVFGGGSFIRWWSDRQLRIYRANYKPKYCPRCGCSTITKTTYFDKRFNTETGAGLATKATWIECSNNEDYFWEDAPRYFYREEKNIPIEPKC